MATPISIVQESASTAETLAERRVAREHKAVEAQVGRAGLPNIGRWLIFADIAVATAAYVAAIVLRAEVRVGEEAPLAHLNWSMFLLLGLTFGLFYLLGLYEDEVFVSRPIHLWTLLRALFYAFIIAAGVIYLAHLPIWNQSRLVVMATFVLFFAFAGILRVGVLTRLYFKRVPRHSVATLVVGDANRTAPLRERLKELRVFNRLELLDTGCGGTVSAPWFKMMLWQTLRRSPVRVAHVFIDAPSLEAETVLDMTTIARQAGAEVYVVSPLIRSLNCRRLLFDLFEAPVVRLRRAPHEIGMSWAKRSLDIIVSLVMLVVCAPLLLALAIAIKVTSPGPVLYRQERVGRKGRPFTLLKFRSMRVASDPAIHEEHMRSFINGNAKLQAVGNPDDPDEIYKLASDPRITKVGRFVRKYSLDELPQLWNVLAGDMSLVGPRPPLGYEVAEYREWHLERLAPAPGLSGLWQVQSRSRVSFDDMVFQDVMYGCTQDALVDAVICLKTIPAALIGHGAV